MRSKTAHGRRAPLPAEGGGTPCFQGLASIPQRYRVPTTPNPVGTGTHSRIPDPRVSRKKSTETGPLVRLMRATARGGPVLECSANDQRGLLLYPRQAGSKKLTAAAAKMQA